MRKTLTVLAALFLLASLAGIAFLLDALPPEIVWRLQVVAAKLNGGLADIPALNLVEWLAPGSPVYLAPLAENRNPYAAIRNIQTDSEAVAAGREAYSRHCARCHGDDARGGAGPDLVSAVASKSDWSFFAAAKWGKSGTSMLPEPLSDREIWSVHAFVRHESLLASREPVANARMHLRMPVNVQPEDILESDRNPSQWLTYAGNYAGHRHTALAQITKQNVKDLRVAWVTQLPSNESALQASPLVVGGTLYLTRSREGVIALDADTGDRIWTFRRPVPEKLPLCCGAPNRGAAVIGSTVYVATVDAWLIALDANTGRQRWITRVADYHDGYSITGAPLVVANRVFVGVAGGEFGVRGFLAAFDATDGHLLWKFNTVPEPGEAGHDTWAGDSWKTGGAPTWTVGAYDKEQDLVIWGVGNPAPPRQAVGRGGDNLYSNSVIAVDAGSGRLRWYYQFTPGDEHDWDATQQPVLAEITWNGAQRRVVLWANRNGFYYALDRTDGRFLFAKPFVKQTWAEGFDAAGRPLVAPGSKPTRSGALVWPNFEGATNWWPPSYDVARQLVFVPNVDGASLYFESDDVTFEKGELFIGSTATSDVNQPAAACLTALDAQTGNVRWRATLEASTRGVERFVSGVLSTATGIVYVGHRDRFFAFDADSGQELWSIRLGGRISGSPVAYEVGGLEHIAVTAGTSLFTFALPAGSLQ